MTTCNTTQKYSNKIILNYINILTMISLNENFSEIINELLNYYQKENVTKDDNEKIYMIISNIDLSVLFELSLSAMEKYYCESEFAKFLTNPNEYTVPDLEKIIENGELLKRYIEYKIDDYNSKNTEAIYFSDYKLLKIK